MITWKQNLKHLSRKEYEYLRLLCHLSKNVYNSALYNVRQQYATEGTYLNYNANFCLMKTDENYLRLGGGIAQQTMRCVDAAFQSYFGLLKAVKKNLFSPREINIPKYLDKDGMYPLHFTDIKLSKDGTFLVPVSQVLRKETDVRIRLHCPPPIRNKHIRQIHIVPRCRGKYFEARYMFDEDEVVQKPELDPSKVLAIDLGVNNFATCATSDFDAFIIDGRKIKSINQWYNKELARLSSIKDHQGMKKQWTKRMYNLKNKRNRSIQNYIYCSAKYIVNYCIEHRIGNIVYGYNDGFQANPNLGRVNNQKFVMIPFGKLKSRLQFLCERYGINFLLQEESYTSKASFFDNDEMPVWNSKNPAQGHFNGTRTYRGLYTTACGTTFNADVNGALNILRKSKLNDISTDIKQCRGAVITPLRITCTPQGLQVLKKKLDKVISTSI